MIKKSVSKNAAEKDEVGRLHEIINQFIVSCSHSMRGPLKSIEGLTTLIRGTPPGNKDEASILLDLVNVNIYKMEHMLDEMEYFLENHKRRVLSKSTDLRKLLEEVVSDFDDQIETEHVTLSLEVPADSHFATDANRLRVVLRNLLDNAIRFHHKKSTNKWARIRVDIQPTLCTITITDNGIGFPLDQYKKAPGPFFRGSAQSNGFGMGLYLVREVLLKMKGNISIDSTPDEGSTITIQFPGLESNESLQ